MNTPKTHDYTKRYFGHDVVAIYVSDDGGRASLMGWGRGLSNDDFLILPNDNGGTRYRINSLRYINPQSDMWLSGEPIERIQALCGHADKSTTEKYIKARWRESLAPNVVKMK